VRQVLILPILCAFANLCGCTTIHSVGGGPDGEFYVAAHKSFVIFSGPSYVVRCKDVDPSSVETLSCERMFVSFEAAKLAPGVATHALFEHGQSAIHQDSTGRAVSAVPPEEPSYVDPSYTEGQTALPQAAFRVADAVYAATGRTRPTSDADLIAQATTVWNYVKEGKDQATIVAAAKKGIEALGPDASIEQILAVGVLQAP
jgi:hypothetical protein